MLTNLHELVWVPGCSLGPWLLSFQVQSIRHHTHHPFPQIFGYHGKSQRLQDLKVFWEKQSTYLAGNYSLSLMPYHLTKDWSVPEGL